MNKLFALGTVLVSSAICWSAHAAAPNDAQIAAIVVAANQVDINAGQLAKSKAENKEVKAFAERMATDHTGENKSAVDLATKLKVKPEENKASRTLKSNGADTVKKLKALH